MLLRNVVAVASVGVLFTLAPVEGQSVRDSSRIVFVYSAGKAQGDLYTIAPDGTGSRRIAEGNFALPVFSPNGSQIAAVRTVERPTTTGRPRKEQELWVMNADGNQSHLTVPEFPFAARPTWMPDGERLIYSYKNTIYLIDADGKNSQRIGEGLSPQPSPDGQSIAFTHYESGVSDLWRMQVDGSNEKRLTGGLDPRWSPNGDRLLFLRKRATTDRLGRPDSAFDLWVMSSSGGQEQKLADDVGLGVLVIPQWSPDGRWIAYHHDRNLWIVESQGGRPRQLTHIVQPPSSQQRIEMEQSLSMCWSPDGTQIAFVHSALGVNVDSVTPNKLQRRIEIVSTDGSQHRSLANFRGSCEEPDWR